MLKNKAIVHNLNTHYFELGLCQTKTFNFQLVTDMFIIGLPCTNTMHQLFHAFSAFHKGLTE
jgi:hypothetical protein